MKISTTCALLLTSTYCLSETESFDMTLSGDFQKDYCSLEIDSSSPRNLDIPAIMQLAAIYKQYGIADKVQSWSLGSNLYLLSCSGGTYDISINNDFPTHKQPLISGVSYYNSAVLAKVDNITRYDLANPQRAPISAVDTFRLQNVEYPSATQGVITFGIEGYAYSEDGTWDVLSDTFNVTSQVVLTIDKH